MGKRLIIKGADFSENGIPSDVNITSLFSTWESGTLDADGLPKTTSVYVLSNPVDISNYAGRTMRFTNSAYRSTSGLQPGFYSFFFDSNGEPISKGRTRVQDSGQNNYGYTVVQEIIIPTNAKTFKATYFDKKVSFTFDDFYCIIEAPVNNS